MGQLELRAQNLALTHVAVFDPASGTMREDRTILVEGNRIVKVGAVRSTKVPSGYRTYALQGKYVIPGLWDMHVHLAGLSANPSWSADLLLPMLIENGILGVRDMGGDPDALARWKSEIEAGKRLGPHIVATGKMIDGSFEDPSVITIHSPDQGRQAVKQIAASGADFVKVLSGITREEYFAIMDEANKQELKVAGHLTSEITAEQAIAAGQHSFEHIIYSGIPLACTANEEQLDKKMAAAMKSGAIRQIGAVLDQAASEYDADRAQTLWRELRDHHAAVVPTLVSTYVNANMDTLSKQTEELKGFPEKLQQEWSPAAMMPYYKPDKLALYKRELEREERLVNEMLSAGVLVLPGSDSLDPHNIPGASLHKELELWVDAGITPAQALKSATADSAEFLGLSDRGSIAPGKIADLVILDADPLQDIANTRKIRATVIGGRYRSITNSHLAVGH
jgi:imidazolonepropionase-like amidohydrolase